MRSGANALEDAFCRAYTCAEAIEKFLARSLAPLNEPGTYALPGETKMTVVMTAMCREMRSTLSGITVLANLMQALRMGLR